MKRLFLGIAAVVCLAAPRLAVADDVWDLANPGPGDDGSYTDNELSNGADQVHDLAAHAGPTADEDWYLVGQQPYSSYEVIADGLTEEIAYIPATTLSDALQLDLVDSGGNLITSGYAFSSLGAARTLRFRNATATEIIDQYVRVRSGTGGCNTACDNFARYRIKFTETTNLIPRFNNSATQITVLVVQNGSKDSVSGTARFWNPTGTLLASQDFTAPSKGTFVINTSGIAGVAGQSGSITLDHTGPYGGLSGKAVAVEPATGFTFDTAMVPKFTN